MKSGSDLSWMLYQLYQLQWELRKLVNIEFPDEMDAPEPPIFREVEDEFYEPGISQDQDSGRNFQ